MAENTKRYYWLKLKDDFFDEKYIKALRKLPQGDSLAIVYLKMQLKSLKTEGIIKYEGIMPDAMTELALLLDEDENVVRLAVEALIRFGVVERWDNDTFYLVQLQQLIGSETQGAARVRKHRELKKTQHLAVAQNSDTIPALQCNADVTTCNTEKEIEIRDRDKSIELESKEKKEKKEKYGTFNNVLLTPAELAKLQNEYSNYDEAIEYLSEYLESTGKKYKSHYMAMRRWVFDALKEKAIKQKELEQREARAVAMSNKPSAYSSSGNPFLDLARDEGIIDGGEF